MRLFPRKRFFTLYSFFNWPNFIAWLPLLLKISGSRCNVMTCYSTCYSVSINFVKLTLTFSSSRSSASSKSQNKKSLKKSQKQKKAVKVKLKTFVIIFKGLSIFRNGLTSKSARLTPRFLKYYIATYLRRFLWPFLRDEEKHCLCIYDELFTELKIIADLSYWI